MINIIKSLNSFFKDKKNNDKADSSNENIKEYSLNMDETEDILYKEFGNCKQLKNNNVKILFITNTNNELINNSTSLLNGLKQIKDYDACILLGGHSKNDIATILKYISKDKIYGILGNNDDLDLLDSNGIPNINGQVIQIKNLRIASIQGCHKYKDDNTDVMYTHEQSIIFADSIPEADILISYDKPYISNSNDLKHDGLKGITHYIYKNHIPIHIYGHMHQTSAMKLKNGTKSFCIHNIDEINFNNL